MIGQSLPPPACKHGSTQEQENSNENINTIDVENDKTNWFRKLPVEAKTLFIVNALLVICNAVLAGVGIFQLTAISKQAGIMREQKDIMIKQWQVASDSLDEARKSSEPRITPTKITLVAFEELNTIDAVKRRGYPPLYQPVFKDGVYTGRSRVYAELLFWDAKKDERLYGNRIMTTLDDVEKERKRLHLPQDQPLKKHVGFLFSFRNTGQLSAHDIKINIQLKDAKGKIEYPFDQISELAGGEEQDIQVDYYFNIDVNLGYVGIEHITVTTEYKYAGKVYKISRKVFYQMFGNKWGFE